MVDFAVYILAVSGRAAVDPRLLAVVLRGLHLSAGRNTISGRLPGHVEDTDAGLGILRRIDDRNGQPVPVHGEDTNESTIRIPGPVVIPVVQVEIVVHADMGAEQGEVRAHIRRELNGHTITLHDLLPDISRTFNLPMRIKIAEIDPGAVDDGPDKILRTHAHRHNAPIPRCSAVRRLAVHLIHVVGLDLERLPGTGCAGETPYAAGVIRLARIRFLRRKGAESTGNGLPRGVGHGDCDIVDGRRGHVDGQIAGLGVI